VSILSRLFGRDRPPVAAVEQLEPDERIISWASLGDGSAAVASPLGLWLPYPDGPRRVPWHLVDRVTWRDGILTVTAAVDRGGGVLAEEPPFAVRLAEPRDLPPTVRVRVERSIAYSRHYRLSAGGGVRVVGRRVAGAEGLTWQLVFDSGADQDDPAVRDEAALIVEVARVETGGPT
jgi:hypothetical protein